MKNILLLKNARLLHVLSFAFLFLLSSQSILGQGTETFAGLCVTSCTPSNTSYATRSWTGVNGITWGATDSRSDQTITTNAITIRNGALTFGLTSAQQAAGIGSLTLSAKAPFGSPDVGTLQLVVNGTIVSSKATTGAATTSVVSYTWSAINVSTLTSIVINQTTSGSRITIDDISWTAAPASGSTAPTLTAAAGATVDAPFDVTYTDDATWRGAITGVTVGGTALTAGYTVSAGKVTFTPSASVPAGLLQSTGTKSIVVNATGYTGATVSQTIGVGAANKLAMNIQPAAPTTNGGALATQPKVNIVDQYGNTTTSTASVTAAVGAGTWTLGGTTSVAAVSGTTTFSGLTASGAAAVSGATIAFSCSGLTGVTSSAFNIPAPAPANDLCGNATTLTVNGGTVAGTLVGTTNTANTLTYQSATPDVWYKFTTATAGSHTITLNFTALTNRDIDFDVFTGSTCPTTGAATYTAHGTTTTEAVTATLTAGASFYIRVIDYGQNANSVNGGAITIGITGPVPAVNPTFASYPNVSKIYGDTGFSMTASSDSPGAISYTSTNTAVATINSSTGAVIIKGAGTTQILVTQAAATGYNTGSTSATLTVNKANGITITANTVSKPYGNTLSNGSVMAFSVSGFQYTEGLGTGATVNVAYGSGAASTDAVGSYTGSVVPSSLTLGTGATYNSANYNATTYVSGDLTVTVASQAITFAATDSKVYGTADYAPEATSATSSIHSITYSSSNTAVADVVSGNIHIVGVGSTTITANQAGDSNYSAATATQTLTVTAKGLTISGLTANNKIYDGTTDATLSGTASLVGVVGSDDVTLTGTPVASFISASVGNAKQVTVTGYSLNGTTAGNYTLTQPTLFADIIATTPTLFTSGTLNGLSTVYGTASGTTSFAVSGQSLNEGILVTAPTGFEVSNGGGYAGAVTVGGSGNVSSTTITVRLAAATAVGTYSGNIVVSSNGAVTLNVATVSSTVTPKGLTISGLTGNDKTYDGNTTATVSGTATLNGVVGSDNVTLNSALVTYNFATATAGTGKSITVAGFSLNGTSAGNYTVAQPTGLTATINKAASTIAVTGAFTFTYNGTAQGPNTSSVTGSAGAVTYSYNGVSPTVYGSSATRPTNAGSYTVAATVATDANYLTATSANFDFTIGKANQTITLAATDAKTTAITTYTLAANASSGLAITYTSSDHAVATISGNTVTIVGAGTTTITANQAGNANYNAAAEMTQNLTVTAAAVVMAAWDFTGFGNSTLNTFGATTFNAGLVSASGANNITRGTGAAWSGAANSFRTVGFQNNGISTSNTDYFQTTLTAVAGKTVSLTAINANLSGTNTYVVSPGVSSQFAYSLNGTNFTLIGASPTVTVGSPASLSIDVSGVSALQNVPAGTTITLRYYASGQTGTGGWGFFSASAGSNGLAYSGFVSAIPAPAITSALTASGTVGTAFSYATTATNSPSSYAASGLPAGLSINTTSGAITGTPSVAGTFTISLSAANATGTDTKTLVITVAKGNQAITFNTLASKTYGDASFTLNGTASSGLTVSYSSSNTDVATISGNTVTIVGAGSTTITASQAGDDNYFAATAVNQTLVVGKANQTITFGTLSPKNDTDGSFTLGATASSGLTVSYSSSTTSVLTISGNTVTIVAPGTSVITASQAGNNNYNAATSVDQEQNIINTSIANQTITFGALSPVTYGDGTFTLSATVNSSLSITYTSSDASIASVTGNTVTIHKPGTVTITASQDGDSTHNPAQDVAQSLVVAKKGLNAVNVSVANKPYDGTTAATLTADLDGVVGTDDVVLNNAAVFASANSGTDIVVTANLTLSGAQADRYEIAQPTGLIATITKVNQVIDFDPIADKTYGNAPFSLVATGGASGEMIVFTSSDPTIATVSGNEVTIVGVGTVTITASQAGNANYNAAANVDQTFTVSKANQTITFNALVNRTTADTSFTLSAFSSSFLAVSYSSSNTAVATVSGNVVTIVGSGSTVITASQAGDTLYNAASDVTQTQLVLTAIAKWTFDGVTTTNTGTTPTVSAGSAIADQGDQTSGSLFSGIHTSSATVWSNPTGNGSVKSLTSSNWGIGDYYQFKVNTLNYHAIAIAFDQTGSNTGPSTFKIQYSTNGTTYSDFGSTYVLTNDNWTSASYKSASNRLFDLSALTALNNKSAIYFRVVNTSTNAINGIFGTGGTNRIDNFVVTGLECNGPIAGITNNTATTQLSCNVAEINVTATGGDTYSWSDGTTVVGTSANLSITNAGTYTVTVTSANGCLSTAAITTTLLPTTSHTTTQSACDTFTWTAGNGNTYTESGSYTYVNGCHTETLALTITPSTSHTTTASACDTYTWSVNNVAYTVSGSYSVVTGCHTEYLNLTINPGTSHTTPITACGSYKWSVNNVTYTESGKYTVVTDCNEEILELTITPETSNTTTQSACDSYTWSVNDELYTASGTYTVVRDCHTETLVLTITPSSTNTTTVSAFGSYTWTAGNGNTYTESGTYPYTVGCHTEMLHLTITTTAEITTQPATTYICGTVGSTATYSVASTMTNATYTWQYRVPTATNAEPAWITITSANAAVYSNYNTAALTVTRTATLPAKGTQYRVLIDGDSPLLTSDVATITILTAVKAGSITVPATSVCLGNDLTMTLSGYAGTSFQWESSPLSSSTVSGVFTPIDGATGPTYTLTNAQLNADRSYHVIVTNACDNTTATSATKTITVNPTSVAGSIILGGGTVCEGASGSMKVAGYVGKIQWQYSTDGVDYVNAPKALDGQLSPFGTTSTNSTGASYLVNNISTNLYFRVKVTSGACSSAYTEPVQYVIGTSPLVGTASSASSQLCAGTGTTLNLTNATGVISWMKTTNGGLTWSTIANSNTLSISTGNLTATTAFKASVTIGGTCGVAESNLVVINVDKASKGGTVSPVKVGTEACSGVAKQLKVASNLGSIQWQSSADGVNYTDIDGATAALYDAVITAPTWFRVEATSGVCSSAYSNAIQLTLSAPAGAGTLSGAADTVCASSGTTITLGGTTNGILVWQKSTNWNATTPTWSTISATLIINNQFSTGNLTASTAYRVMATSGACVDYSTVYVVAVTAKPVAKAITANPTSPLGTAATSALCTDNSVAKVLTIGLGSVGTIQWETVVSATTPTALTVWTPIQNANGTSYTITNPSAGVNYFRAKFSNGVCADVYNAAFKVYYTDCGNTEGGTIIKAAVALPFNVVAYPNPYSDNFHLNLTTSSDANVAISIYDMTGKLLDKREVGVDQASELSIGDRFASGVYNVVVTQGSEVKTLRVVKR